MTRLAFHFPFDNAALIEHNTDMNNTRFEQAACVIVPTGNTIEEILVVSRRHDATKWGLPGGKQETGESNAMCACREVGEEAGLLLAPEDLIPIYSGPCYGADGRNFWVTTYLLNEIFTGIIESPEEGILVKPTEIITLCNERISPFASYNQQVVGAWRALR